MAAKSLPVILALGKLKLKQDYHEFNTNLGHKFQVISKKKIIIIIIMHSIFRKQFDSFSLLFDFSRQGFFV